MASRRHAPFPVLRIGAETSGLARMDFKERVPLGRTGLMVSRIGVASGYGVPAAASENAFLASPCNHRELLRIRAEGFACDISI